MTGNSSPGSDTSNTPDIVSQTADTAIDDNGGVLDAEAQSSGAKDATETTLLDVIAAAVAPKKEEGDGPASSDGEGSQDVADVDTAAGDKPNATDDSNVPFHKHPRWQEKLAKERELTQQVEQYRSGHEQYEQIQRFMTVNQLSPEEVVQGYQIMALMRRDPAKALEMLTPHLQALELVTGRKLPDDLQQRVDDGVDSPETARETANLRMQAERDRREAEHRQRVDQQRQQQSTVQTIQSAVTAVEAELKGSDPDYARKQSFIADRVRALIAERKPKTDMEATAILRDAHAEVSRQLGGLVQKKTVTTTTSSAAATTGRTEPKTLLEAVRLAASKT
jgi:hypothetical protein